MRTKKALFGLIYSLTWFAAACEVRTEDTEADVYPGRAERTRVQMAGLTRAVAAYADSSGDVPMSLGIVRSLRGVDTLREGQAKDAWGIPLEYSRVDSGFTLRSGGPDGKMGTQDDLTHFERVSLRRRN
jgi:hypothetical protein